MKTRASIILIGLALFLSSCIVKSIQPFYTVESQYFDDRLIGDFISEGKSTWKFTSFKTEWKKENQDQTKLTKDDYDEFERYKNAYYVEYISKGSEAYFIAMPFKVDNHLFLNFTPFYFEENDLNGMAAQHLLKTHSAAKVNFNKNGSLKLSWISESVVKRLFNEQKMRLKHEKVGVNEDLVLTASSEELHSFLKKFMSSEIENKWNNDDIITLNPNNARP
ncbi:hypothetical protein [Winogradskyella sp.]|uniref:hypothetical protein n=1 Tax=Winogradskyella sp. TaxID=1883156 RepID=UPI002622AB78|nr:hypothetical protein [Winogradskyella sp.]